MYIIRDTFSRKKRENDITRASVQWMVGSRLLAVSAHIVGGVYEALGLEEKRSM